MPGRKRLCRGIGHAEALWRGPAELPRGAARDLEDPRDAGGVLCGSRARRGRDPRLDAAVADAKAELDDPADAEPRGAAGRRTARARPPRRRRGRRRVPGARRHAASGLTRELASSLADLFTPLRGGASTRRSKTSTSTVRSRTMRSAFAGSHTVSRIREGSRVY